MACKLTPRPGSPPVTPGPPPSGPTDFNAKKNAEITVFVDSDSGTVHLTAARINGTKITLDANEKATFKVPDPTNFLDLGFVAADPTEIFRIKEDCGGGDSQVLRTWRTQPFTPGGPTAEIRIHTT